MRKHFPFWKVLAAVAVLAVALSLSFLAVSQPSASGVSLNHKLTNISDTAFAISWTTEFPCKAYIEYGKPPSLGDKAHDDRGEGTVSGLHHIWVKELVPETSYYYDRSLSHKPP